MQTNFYYLVIIMCLCIICYSFNLKFTYMYIYIYMYISYFFHHFYTPFSYITIIYLRCLNKLIHQSS